MRAIVRIISLLLLLCSLSCERVDVDVESASISVKHLWSMSRGNCVRIKDDVVIRGYVTANDIVGELQRSFIISDDTGGVEVKVDADDIDYLLPMHTPIAIHCSGLYLGREGGTLTLGLKPTGVYAVDRIPEEQLFNYVTIEDRDDVVPLSLVTISEVDYEDMFRYVVLKDIWVVDQERGLRWCDVDIISGEAVATLRHFTDGRDTIPIITAPTASYHSEHLPSFRAQCIGVVDVHKNMVALRLSNHQITPMEE